MDLGTRRLSEDELQQLEGLLVDNGCSVKSVAMLNGLIAGVTCLHGELTIKDWVNGIWPTGNLNGSNGEDATNKFIELLSRFLLEVTDSIDNNSFIPKVSYKKDGEPVFTDWVLGFKNGVQTNPGLLSKLVGDERGVELLKPIYMADVVAGTGISEGPEKVVLSKDDKIRLIKLIGISVVAIKDFLGAYCHTCLGDSAEVLPITYKKISRNEPCPCDSGKKYKKCCLVAADLSN